MHEKLNDILGDYFVYISLITRLRQTRLHLRKTLDLSGDLIDLLIENGTFDEDMGAEIDTKLEELDDWVDYSTHTLKLDKDKD